MSSEIPTPETIQRECRARGWEIERISQNVDGWVYSARKRIDGVLYELRSLRYRDEGLAWACLLESMDSEHDPESEIRDACRKVDEEAEAEALERSEREERRYRLAGGE